ncbi:MAG: cobalamin-dependent protein, partial [Gammaproteobacteria bacterium]
MTATAPRREEAIPESSKPLRFVTAASLFDGHDAAINVMRRLIQGQGAEVVHLGHNRSVREIVRAALQEDADGIAISSYQGGHNEFFRYMVDMLRESNASHNRVFGGGGGTITPEEIDALQAYGVERIYHPRDGMTMGLVGMIEDLVQRTAAVAKPPARPDGVTLDDEIGVAQMISAIEEGVFSEHELARLRKEWTLRAGHTPVVGITGTGGAGKSSVTDEILSRMLRFFPDRRIAVLAVDPTRRRTGGALLGDRIRMNSLVSERLFMRSMATRRQHLATNEMLGDVILFLKSLGVDMVIVETAGIGQSDSEIVDLVDYSVYVMTSEYGAATQLEKIDMLDFADMVILNKFDKRGAEDALRDVRKQWRRNHNAFEVAESGIPVFPTIASQFNDPGVNWAFRSLCLGLAAKMKLPAERWTPSINTELREPKSVALIPGNRVRYLAEIAEGGRGQNARAESQAEIADRAQHLYETLRELADPALPAPLTGFAAPLLVDSTVDNSLRTIRQRYQAAVDALGPDSLALLREWPERLAGIRSEQYSYTVRGKEIRGDNYKESLSRLQIPKIGAPGYKSWGEQLRFLLKHNLPGHYPYTAGVFPY